ncbi:amino acid transporter [Paecilomyces variotii No. 5]|uniref:Amino acid transporter n=1 Tax=Byssochlamys spectabilis (strain No. 5 / NBRC 109023) TaxID=1356009 RepID=V5HWK2_BYSSN|nr:amino acid transporter [Paecilomyces variotii No. 5]
MATQNPDRTVDDIESFREHEEKQLDPELPDYEGAHADPFGNEEFSEVKYKVMEWWQCGMIMVAETISLGILSLPSAVAALGLAPAIVLIIGLGLLATYTGYVIGQFKLRYPHVHSMADAGEILMGRFGREFLGNAQLIFLIFIMGSHLLTFTVMMNTLTDHGTCSIVFGVVGLIVSFVCALPRTMLKVSWMSIGSFISIVAALLITMIAISIEHPGKAIDATVDTNLYNGFLAVTNIVFAYAGHVAFFGFISELKRAEEYPKTLYMLQSIDTSMYLVAAVVIYYYGGRDVASPALGSTGPIVRKVAYGIAIPTIVIAGVINGHVAAKYIYVRLFRGTDRMHKRSFVSVGSWISITLILWVIAWVIAEAIPVFNNLLSLITALFASWFTYGLSGIFWLFLNRGKWFSSPRKIILTVVNVVIFGIGACLCGLGLYVSGKAIHDSPSSASFSCASNA